MSYRLAYLGARSLGEFDCAAKTDERQLRHELIEDVLVFEKAAESARADDEGFVVGEVLLSNGGGQRSNSGQRAIIQTRLNALNGGAAEKVGWADDLDGRQARGVGFERRHRDL